MAADTGIRRVISGSCYYPYKNYYIWRHYYFTYRAAVVDLEVYSGISSLNDRIVAKW
jgi:hypothetical protein